jgi:hypothetical protein
MRYALLLHGVRGDHAPATPGDGVFERVEDYIGALRDAGVLLGVEELRPAETATGVRMRAGERLLTDGPFAETKEHLLGFFLLEVAGLDEALDWAARMPHVRSGTVEVRPVVTEARWRSALG